MNNIKIKELLFHKIEDVIPIIENENLTKREIQIRISKSKLQKEDKVKVQQKIDFAFKRISEPLDLQMKIICFLIPFGLVTRIGSNNIFDVNHHRKLGFKKKVRDFYSYSFLGFLTYLFIIIILISF